MNYQIAYLIMKKTWSNFIFQQGLSRNKAIWLGIASQLIIAVILSYGTGSVTALDFTRLLAQDWFVDISHPYLLLWMYNEVWKLFIRLYCGTCWDNISLTPSFCPSVPTSHRWWSSVLLCNNDIIQIYTRERQKLYERHSIDVLYFTAEIWLFMYKFYLYLRFLNM